MSSYTENEKFHIAQEHLIPKVKDENGLKPEQLKISDRALQKMISGYTREAGVRNLERRLSEIARKAARKVWRSEDKCVKVTGQNVEKYLGKEDIRLTRRQTRTMRSESCADWHGRASEVIRLEIEVNVMPGKGEFTAYRTTGRCDERVRTGRHQLYPFGRGGISYSKEVFYKT